MAHGQNANKQRGKEWWGKRPFSGHAISPNSKINKAFKRFLHKTERQEGKKQINNEE
jgi:hypothetical protein